MFTYIKLKNYCSLVDFQVNFMGKRDNPKKLILIYGENGVGKSNLATAFFTLYETLRTMSIKDMLENFVNPYRMKNSMIVLSRNS